MNAEWARALWNPPKRLMKCAQKAVSTVDKMIGEHDKCPADKKTLRDECLFIFKRVWQGRMQDANDPQGCAMMDKMRAETNNMGKWQFATWRS